MIDAVSTSAGAAQAGQRDRLKAVATQFEAVFLRQMISSMRSASLGDDILGSDATEQFRDMADGRTADAMAEKGALGIAELLLKQFGGSEPARAFPVQLDQPFVSSEVETRCAEPASLDCARDERGRL
jgi:flagellar protein FlgJ